MIKNNAVISQFVHKYLSACLAVSLMARILVGCAEILVPHNLHCAWKQFPHLENDIFAPDGHKLLTQKVSFK